MIITNKPLSVTLKETMLFDNIKKILSNSRSNEKLEIIKKLYIEFSRLSLESLPYYCGENLLSSLKSYCNILKKDPNINNIEKESYGKCLIRENKIIKTILNENTELILIIFKNINEIHIRSIINNFDKILSTYLNNQKGNNELLINKMWNGPSFPSIDVYWIKKKTNIGYIKNNSNKYSNYIRLYT